MKAMISIAMVLWSVVGLYVIGYNAVRFEIEQYHYRQEWAASQEACKNWRAKLPNDGLSDDNRIGKILRETNRLDGGCWEISRTIKLPRGATVSNASFTFIRPVSPTFQIDYSEPGPEGWQ